MKTDKELLILAAKAAGVSHHGFCAKGLATAMNGACKIRPWNPLTEDGDALRLAVDLELDVFPKWGETCSAITSIGKQFAECPGADKHAATRRAIVRAAAAIGEGME